MTELKPCPFCGGKAELKQDMRYPRSGKYAGMSVKAYEVICPNSDCIIYNADNNYFFTREEAAEAWNRRSPDWISVNKRLPEESGDYLVFVEGMIENMLYSKQHSAWNADDLNCHKNYEITTVTHWMPLPEPPEQEGESET